jgi:hypothetical protein
MLRLLAAGMILAGCAQAIPAGVDPTISRPPTPARSPDRAGCPVGDDDACRAARGVIDALRAGDPDAVLRLTREMTVDCTKVDRRFFQACATNTSLRGYQLTASVFSIEVLSREVYRDRLAAILANVDTAFQDEHGSGEIRSIGIGTCGPNVPDRRSYHVAWTAAVRGTDRQSERIVASFELTFAEDWRVALWFADTLRAWERAGASPMTNGFCQAGQHPWRS